MEVELWVRRLEVYWGPKTVQLPHAIDLVRDQWIMNRVAYYNMTNGLEILKTTVTALENSMADDVFKKGDTNV